MEKDEEEERERTVELLDERLRGELALPVLEEALEITRHSLNTNVYIYITTTRKEDSRGSGSGSAGEVEWKRQWTAKDITACVQSIEWA